MRFGSECRSRSTPCAPRLRFLLAILVSRRSAMAWASIWWNRPWALWVRPVPEEIIVPIEYQFHLIYQKVHTSAASMSAASIWMSQGSSVPMPATSQGRRRADCHART